MTTPVVGLSAGVDASLAIFDRLKGEADGGLLAGVSVDYEWSAGAGLEQIYFGGWRSSQEDLVEEHGVLMQEIVSISMYVRVIARPPTSRRETDLRAKAIAAIVGQILKANPHLGGMTWLGLTTTQGDYSPSTMDETISSHAYNMQVGANVVWGQ